MMTSVASEAACTHEVARKGQGALEVAVFTIRCSSRDPPHLKGGVRAGRIGHVKRYLTGQVLIPDRWKQVHVHETDN